jgi:hypothetical protein
MQWDACSIFTCAYTPLIACVVRAKHEFEIKHQCERFHVQSLGKSKVTPSVQVGTGGTTLLSSGDCTMTNYQEHAGEVTVDRLLPHKVLRTPFS